MLLLLPLLTTQCYWLSCCHPVMRQVVFIRHGESTWNETFNRNKLFLLPRMIYSAAYEIFLILSGA